MLELIQSEEERGADDDGSANEDGGDYDKRRLIIEAESVSIEQEEDDDWPEVKQGDQSQFDFDDGLQDGNDDGRGPIHDSEPEPGYRGKWVAPTVCFHEVKQWLQHCDRFHMYERRPKNDANSMRAYFRVIDTSDL
jgi:hypothetical protein